MTRKKIVSQVLAAVMTLVILAATAFPLVHTAGAKKSAIENTRLTHQPAVLASNPSGGGNGGG
ncbi:MAG TPA: hypothetical protein VJ972_08870 [Anaerolineales bacterium]|nr:hypothetical protein [Anaerolineales bacterium]